MLERQSSKRAQAPCRRGWRSSGLVTPTSGRSRRWREIMVVSTEEWPRSDWRRGSRGWLLGAGVGLAAMPVESPRPSKKAEVRFGGDGTVGCRSGLGPA